MSPNLIDAISYFNVIQDTNLPSDHAPICVCFNKYKLAHDMSDIKLRSNSLGKHAVLANMTSKKIQRRQILPQNIRINNLTENLRMVDPPDITDVNTAVSELDQILINSVADSIVDNYDSTGLSNPQNMQQK